MLWNPEKVRRWSGGIYLATAIGMLVAGMTFFKERLTGMGFAIYWLICMLLTFLALMIALLDVRAVRRQLQQQQNDMLREVLANVERKRKESDSQGKPAAPEPGND